MAQKAITKGPGLRQELLVPYDGKSAFCEESSPWRHKGDVTRSPSVISTKGTPTKGRSFDHKVAAGYLLFLTRDRKSMGNAYL